MITNAAEMQADQIRLHALGVKVDDRCDRCSKFYCICFENAEADRLNAHKDYNYE